MRLPFSIKLIYLIEWRNFDQKYKFSNKNDMVSAWRNFQKNSCGISTYDNWNFNSQISSIFHFDRASDGRMAHVLGVKANFPLKRTIENGLHVKSAFKALQWTYPKGRASSFECWKSRFYRFIFKSWFLFILKTIAFSKRYQ